jgi:hypothetical protein
MSPIQSLRVEEDAGRYVEETEQEKKRNKNGEPGLRRWAVTQRWMSSLCSTPPTKPPPPFTVHCQGEKRHRKRAADGL